MQINTRVDYDELGLISKSFHDEGEDFAQIFSSTRQKTAALRSEWVGEAADKFFDEMENGLLPALHRLSQGLIVSQEVLNKIMKTIFEADQETRSFFGDAVGAGGGMALGIGALGAAAAGMASGGDDFGAGLFNQAQGDPGSTPGSDAGGGTGDGPSETTDHFTVSKDDMAPFVTPDSQTPPAAETPPAPASAAGGGGGGGGGGASGQGLQGNLDGMGSGLGGQPASNASVGGSSGGAESLPDHIFGGGGSSGGGSGLPSQGGVGGSSSGGGDSGSSGGGGIAAGAAGVAGSAAVGGAAKVLKDKQDNEQ